jgi:hypothetical protein
MRAGYADVQKQPKTGALNRLKGTKMLRKLKTITKRFIPDKALLETPPQIGANVLTQLRLHSSLHRLLEQQIRCRTLRKSLD